MTDFFRRYFPLLLIIALALVPILVLQKMDEVVKDPAPPEPSPVPQPPPRPRPALTLLAEPPDWTSLETFQNTITRVEFEKLLTTVFTTAEAWRDFIWIKQNQAVIQTNLPGESSPFVLNFASPDTFYIRNDYRSASPEKPLAHLHIAIDPGHIGGEWAKMEERWFVVGGGTPVTEGDMTLTVANLLKPKLEALGARVSLVREKPEPVTPVRADALLDTAGNSSKLAERLFYRTAEIHARAKLINETLKPNFVLCLHFNAEGWGDPLSPTLVPDSHFHILLNGAYNNEEIAFADQRYALIRKILGRTHEQEVALATTIADRFAASSQLPPYQYPSENPNVRSIPGQPFLWARNLIANRIYDCPVIFMEPYVMNSIPDHARIQAGDYDGLREINGQMRPSIFREYADALADGLFRHFSTP